MTQYNSNHDNNVEILRTPEFAPSQRMERGVENLRIALIRTEEKEAKIVNLTEYRRKKPAFEQPIIANPAQNDYAVMSVETQATVTDLDMHRKQQAVQAAYEGAAEGYGNPLHRDILSNTAQELLSNAEEASQDYLRPA